MIGIEPDDLGKTLLAIQDLDTRVLRLRREIEDLPRKHQLDELLADLKEARDTLESKKQQLTDLKHRMHKLDGELELLSSKVKKEEEKLFSGTIMNPKELSAIQAEIISLKKKTDEMETEDLEMMEEADRIEREVQDSEKRAEQISSREQEARDTYNEELAEKEHQISELERERDKLKEEIDPETIALYERLLEQKGGLAVAKMEEGSYCGGCRIEFSHTQIDRFQHEEGLFRCEYCRRILVR